MTEPNARISFHWLTRCQLTHRVELKHFLLSLFQREGFRLAELTYVFCDDKYLLALNRKFLGHDYYTDILTFPSSLAGTRTISGEIYISLDRVRDNALSHGVPMREEIHRVIFHGALHLCRFKDSTKKEQNRMRAKEDEYLKRYFR